MAEEADSHLGVAWGDCRTDAAAGNRGIVDFDVGYVFDLEAFFFGESADGRRCACAIFAEGSAFAKNEYVEGEEVSEFEEEGVVGVGGSIFSEGKKNGIVYVKSFDEHEFFFRGIEKRCGRVGR